MSGTTSIRVRVGYSRDHMRIPRIVDHMSISNFFLIVLHRISLADEHVIGCMASIQENITQ